MKLELTLSLSIITLKNKQQTKGGHWVEIATCPEKESTLFLCTMLKIKGKEHYKMKKKKRTLSPTSIECSRKVVQL